MDELENKSNRVTKLEALPEVNTLAKGLKDALMEMQTRIREKQQVHENYKITGAYALFITHRTTVMGQA